MGMRHKIKAAFIVVLVGLLTGAAILWVDWPSLVLERNIDVVTTGDSRANARRAASPITPSQEPSSRPVRSSVRETMPNTGIVDESQIHEELSLLALFETQDSQAASAVVLVKDYGAYRYSVGDKVSEKYLIANIAPDHVLIEVSGQQFRLFLTPLAGGEQSQTERVERSQVSGASILEQTRAERERMRLLSAYDLYPVVEGAAAGYVIGERFPRDMRERVGIEPGDIVLSVNGFALGDAEGDEQAFRSAQTAMKAAIVFQRQDGSVFHYHYPEDAEGH